MNATRRARLALSLLSALVLLLALAAPAAARQHKAAKPQPTPKAAKTTRSCDRPCASVEDCPKVTCECADDAGSGVAACDTEAHCCASAPTACRRFCQLHKQKWTGRFTPDDGTPAPEPSAGSEPAGSEHDANESAALSAPCDERCERADDCSTITCQCAHGAAENVAACDAKAHCCAGPPIVCGHYCGGKKGKWTGKVVEAPPPADTGPSFDDLYDDGDQQE